MNNNTVIEQLIPSDAELFHCHTSDGLISAHSHVVNQYVDLKERIVRFLLINRVVIGRLVIAINRLID